MGSSVLKDVTEAGKEKTVMGRGCGKCLLVLFVVVSVACHAASLDPASVNLTPEQEVERDIDLWKMKRRGQGGAMWEFMTDLCVKVNALPSPEKKRVYYERMADKIFAMRFEDHPEFPLETWGSEPFSLNSNDAKSNLPARHRFMVTVTRELYHGLRGSELPLEDQFAPIFRLAEKVDAEKYRLKTLDIGGAHHVLDEAERDIYAATVGDLTEEKKRLLNQFERTFYRPVRTPEEIDHDGKLLDAAIKTATERMLKAYLSKDGLIRHGEMKYERELKRKKQSQSSN